MTVSIDDSQRYENNINNKQNEEQETYSVPINIK